MPLPPSPPKPPPSGASPTAGIGQRTWATGRPTSPRNLILRYTAPGELVLDQMTGSGTALVECKLLGRNAVGVDINLSSPVKRLFKSSYTKKPQSTQRNINSVISAPSVVDYPYCQIEEWNDLLHFSWCGEVKLTPPRNNFSPLFL